LDHLELTGKQTMQELFSEFPTAFVAVAFVVALLIGSFLNVVIYRLPIMMEIEWRKQCEEFAETPATDLPEGRFDLVLPRSRCSSCDEQITALQNIPVLSYLFLGGKCGHCKAPISKRYPAIELATAILTAAVAWRFGFGWEAAAAIFITWTLIAISVIDFDHQIIPDALSLPLVWAGLLMSLFHPLAGAEVLFVEPKASIVGAIAGYLVLWSIYHVFRMVTGKEGMGYGDFKLLAALGALLGWQMLHLIVLLSAVVGVIVGIGLIVLRSHDRQVPIPFGPFLAAAGWIAMIYGQQIVDRYFQLVG
jgi:leader peptidase (prepilin peptidase)/N-methyltransferase